MNKKEKLIIIIFSICIYLSNFNKILSDDNKVAILDKAEKERILEQIFAIEKDNSTKINVLSATSARELNIIEGREENPEINLFSAINQTVTSYGRQSLKNLLLNPLSDLDKIKQRQKLIQRLANSPELLAQIDEALSKIAKQEDNLHLLWSLNNPFNNQIDLLTALAQITGTSKSKYSIEVIRDLTLASSVAIATALLSKTCSAAYKLMYKHVRKNTHYGWDQSIPLDSYIKPLIFAGITAGYIYKFLPVVYKQEKNNKNMQQMMISIAQTVQEGSVLANIVANIEDHGQVLQNINFINEFKNNKAGYELNSEFQELLLELETKTFKDKASLLSFMGRVRRAYQLAYQLKEQLIPILKAIGEIDAYTSIAKLITSQSKKQNRYCFTKFANNDHPIFDVKNSWNPIIKVDQLITESISLGNGDGLVPNMLLTGPHGGGKSTFMKQLAYCVILSQVFGVAAADSCKMTIFRFINTYLDIKDNPKKAMSAFMAERDRIQKLKHKIQGLPMDKFSFTLIDEPFKATMEKEASILVSKFLTKIEQVTENISVIATHFIEPATESETRKNSRFVNYHMEVNERTPGRFQRLFKLKTGKCQWWFDDSEKRQRYVNWLQTVLY